MNNFPCLRKKFGNFCRYSCFKIACLGKYFLSLITSICRFLVAHLNPFRIQLCYFVSVSFVGFIVLKVLKPKTNSFRPKDIDIFFTSVSATTVSSMSTVEMEVFSNTQLVLMTILMLAGGEVFTSMFGLQFMKSKFRKFSTNKAEDTSVVHDYSWSPKNIELGLVPVTNLENEVSSPLDNTFMVSDTCLKYNSLRYLAYVVLAYLLLVLVGGSILVLVYLSLVSRAGNVLKTKGIKLSTFSVFTVVSTFANCGYVPTNENMIVFKNNPGLLLLLIPQILLGNTMYPSCLRFLIWVLGKVTRRNEFQYMLKHTKEMGYDHLLPFLHSLLLVFTGCGFILVQFILFCSMEWSSGSLDGMNSFQKVVGTLFQTVNTRHAGETIVDLSIISPAILVLFVMLMYLPPYTSFLPIKDDQFERSCEKRNKQGGQLVENLLFSQLSYLIIFIILICITERKKMKDDPLNFSLLNIVVEVISAYGNVGFTTGYSCKRQINPDGHCKDTWYGFSGRWSNEGKLILILVMFFGRLKKFHMGGGKAWKLL